MSDKYEQLLERSIISQERTTDAIEHISDTLNELKQHTKKINDDLGTHIVSQDNIINELKSWLVKAIIALLVAVGGASVLKISGII